MRKFGRMSLRGVLVMGIMLAALMVSMSSVFAGSEGQQLSLHDVYGSIYSATVQGQNQECVTQALDFTWPNPYMNTTNDWWQYWTGFSPGQQGYCANEAVVVYAYKNSNWTDPLATYTLCVGTTCYPPHSQSSSNWTSCVMDRPGGGIACTAGYETE